MVPATDSNIEPMTLDADALAALQRRKLGTLMEAVRASNSFYRAKFQGISFDSLTDPLDRLPFTTRQEIEQDHLKHPPFGSNLTFPLDQYCRFHQTSGTGGRAMQWLDTAQSWAWVCQCWGVIFSAANVNRGDRVLFPFSFGPFLGFWAAFEGAVQRGAMAIPAGGLSTIARLKLAMDNRATAVCCTPTYALRMGETARAEGIDLPGSPVRAIIVAGEAGGSIPETRQRIESLWGARVYDHSGMTEIGPMAFECQPRPGEGLHVIGSQYIPEVIDPSTGKSLGEGEGELVLTNLGRTASPLIRYRTGDRVRLVRGRCKCGSCFARLEGGILGRIDDMFIVRGNNVFPRAVEAVIWRFAEIAEFRCSVHNDAHMAQVSLEIEPSSASDPASTGELARRVAQALQEALHFRATVSVVPAGTLPRFDMKSRRFIRL